LFGSGNSADFRQITSLRLGSESASSTIRGIFPDGRRKV
jgi:hypothetical protein